MSKTFNFYCDESCHLENDHQSYMMIAFIAAPYNQVREHIQQIKEIQAKHNCFSEIKWSKVSKSKYEMYADLIDYFFTSNLQFRAVVIQKDQIDNGKRGQSFDDFYSKMYFQLIYHKLDAENSYNIFVDIKDTHSGERLSKLGEILRVEYSTIRTLQAVRSHESLLLQLADFLMGALSYYKRGLNKVIAKNKLIEKIKHHSGLSLNNSTARSQEKFNLFFIELNKN
jgi:Protein of unknown function (DUF3800)